MIARHPARPTLEQWLTGASSPDIDSHLDSCAKCAATLEEIDAASPKNVGLAEALADALTLPDDLSERLLQGVTARLTSRQIFDVVTDLFGAGFETTRLILTEDDGYDNG